MKFPFIKDPKTGKESVTLSMFIYGFVVATIKLLFAGMEIVDKFKMSDFSGTDYAAVLGALGIVYSLRKNKSIRPDSEFKEEKK